MNGGVIPSSGIFLIASDIVNVLCSKEWVLYCFPSLLFSIWVSTSCPILMSHEFISGKTFTQGVLWHVKALDGLFMWHCSGKLLQLPNLEPLFSFSATGGLLHCSSNMSFACGLPDQSYSLKEIGGIYWYLVWVSECVKLNFGLYIMSLKWLWSPSFGLWFLPLGLWFPIAKLIIFPLLLDSSSIRRIECCSLVAWT